MGGFPYFEDNPFLGPDFQCCLVFFRAGFNLAPFSRNNFPILLSNPFVSQSCSVALDIPVCLAGSEPGTPENLTQPSKRFQSLRLNPKSYEGSWGGGVPDERTLRGHASDVSQPNAAPQKGARSHALAEHRDRNGTTRPLLSWTTNTWRNEWDPPF